MKRIGIAATALLLGACGSMSGLSGKQEFACKAPDGVTCDSVSGVYANSLANNLPSQHAATREPAQARKPESMLRLPPKAPLQPLISPGDLTAMDSGMPIRQPPRVLRAWFAPWEDELGDLHDQKFVYVVVAPGKWMIEANRQTVRDQFRPVFPLSPPSDNGLGKTGPSPKVSTNTRPLGIPSE